MYVVVVDVDKYVEVPFYDGRREVFGRNIVYYHYRRTPVLGEGSRTRRWTQHTVRQVDYGWVGVPSLTRSLLYLSLHRA